MSFFIVFYETFYEITLKKKIFENYFLLKIVFVFSFIVFSSSWGILTFPMQGKIFSFAAMQITEMHYLGEKFQHTLKTFWKIMPKVCVKKKKKKLKSKEKTFFSKSQLKQEKKNIFFFFVNMYALF